MKNKRLALVIGIILLAFPVAREVWAHGIGTPVKINVASDPYLLSIWTDPDPLRVDETHVTVAVMEPETQTPIVTGLEVTVQLTAVADESLSFTATALADNSTNRLLYAAVFENLPTDGRWRGLISVDGPAGAASDVPFEVEVLPPAPFNWLWPGIGGLVVLLLVWWVRSWRRQAPAQPSKR